MSKMWSLGAGSVAALCAGLALGQSEDELCRIAAVARPRTDEVKWQRVPWIVDLAEGQRVARAERRPIFLWATAGTLARC